jgi:hypothetical protein
MLYRWLLSSFLLNLKNHHLTTVVVKNAIDDIVEKNIYQNKEENIPPKENNTAIHKFFKRTTSGRDERYDYYYNESKNQDVLLNISKFMVQMELLRKLESDNISQTSKIKFIEEYEKIHGECKYRHNITAGGLLNDFLKDI